MKMKIIGILIIVFLNSHSANAQNSYDYHELYKMYKETGVYPLVIDLKTGRTTEPKILKIKKSDTAQKDYKWKKYKYKNVYPKINEKFQIIWRNLDTSRLKIETYVTFENKNIENAAMFQKYTNAESVKTISEDKSTKSSGEVKTQVVINDTVSSKQVENRSDNNSNYESLAGFKVDSTKISRYNIDSLNLWGLNRVKNFIQNFDTTTNKHKFFLEKELDITNSLNEMKELWKDIHWYQNTILPNVKTNWNKSVEVRDQIIDSLLKITSSSKVLAVLDSSKSKNYIVESNLDFQIQNYDITHISYKVKDKKTNQVVDFREKFILNKSGFKVDFSVGFVANRLIDEKYKIIYSNVDTTHQTKIVAQPSSKAGVGFGILAHGYWRTGRRTNYGISSGFSVNTNNQVTNFMLGGSLLLGLEQRLVISFGASLGRIKTLSKSQYEVGKVYHKDVLKIDENLEYLELMQLKPFLSITYNISNLIDKKSNPIRFD
jgi:hypothetical protein